MKGHTVEEARARMLEAVNRQAPLEAVSLDEAFGRVLAEPITAARDQPPFDASAMDGWAVNGDGTHFTVVGESAAGHGYGDPLAAGQAVRIFTGAPVPAGASRVVLQEDSQNDDDGLHVPATFDDASRHIRPRGGDFRAGQALLQPGVRLDAWRIGLAAAAGRADLTVARQPRVTVLSTGEEIVPAGTFAGPDQIYNSGGPTLNAMIRGWSASPVLLAPAGDDEAAIAQAVAEAGGDLIVTVGGASVGDHDLVKPALKRLGLTLAVETIKVRPGKPTWFGTLGDGRHVLGLPGNPAAAMVCAELFLRPVLMAMQGAASEPKMARARLTRPLAANGPREHWMRAQLAQGDRGLEAAPMFDQDSSLVTVFAEADALIRRRADAAALDAGDWVELLPLERL